MRKTMETSVWVAKTEPGRAKEDMGMILEKARSIGAEVLVLDADMVFGKDHVSSAAYHARKAIDEKRNSADSLAMETLLYASGQRQLSGAIDKMSVTEDTTRIVIAQLSGPEITSEKGWEPMEPLAKGVSRERLVKYGVSEQEQATIGSRNPSEIILERVAAVDILKK